MLLPPDPTLFCASYIQRREDLIKLDSMVFALRRLCVPLDADFVDTKRPGERNPTNRDILTRQPDYWSVVPGCKLSKTLNGKRGERLRHVLLNFNFPFAPADYPHDDLPSRLASNYPVLWRMILEPLEQTCDSDAATTAVELCRWVLENIQLPRELKAELREAGEKRQE